MLISGINIANDARYVGRTHNYYSYIYYLFSCLCLIFIAFRRHDTVLPYTILYDAVYGASIN